MQGMRWWSSHPLAAASAHRNPRGREKGAAAGRPARRPYASRLLLLRRSGLCRRLRCSGSRLRGGLRRCFSGGLGPFSLVSQLILQRSETRSYARPLGKRGKSKYTGFLDHSTVSQVRRALFIGFSRRSGRFARPDPLERRPRGAARGRRSCRGANQPAVVRTQVRSGAHRRRAAGQFTATASAVR